MDEVTRKRLEFDRIIGFAQQFCLSDMGRDRLGEVSAGVVSMVFIWSLNVSWS
ncbi:hypothetical protein [Prosthecochloris sp. HL-130-GSB]|uniref:hypothetical protein n=1 Tax=Prosthecochloris sp. HL-130-GSB TaxID=1974213 RepID=UPI001E3C48B9|nr:hypothetical protein [Prosthecochloris sp. HL-130-GSB]